MTDTYAQLAQKAEQKFEEIRAQYPSAFRCGRGCSSCCTAGLSVFKVEADTISDYLAQHSAILEHPSPSGCVFLDSEGACRIYPVRPIICRTQGAPLAVSGYRNVCPLNFDTIDLNSLSTNNTISLEQLNTLLALVNAQYEQSLGIPVDQRGARTPLASIQPLQS